MFKRTFVFSISVLVLATGCSLDATLTELTPSLEDVAPDLKTQNSASDFVAGEIVTTGNGVVVKGTFGEISEKQELSNGVIIEGSFYE